MTDEKEKPKEYAPRDRVCPDCGCKHWDHTFRCTRCEDQYQREQQYNYR